MEAVIDVILYADGTSEVLNKRAYDRILTQRKKLAERERKKRIDLGIALGNHSNDLRFIHFERERTKRNVNLTTYHAIHNRCHLGDDPSAIVQIYGDG